MLVARNKLRVALILLRATSCAGVNAALGLAPPSLAASPPTQVSDRAAFLYCRAIYWIMEHNGSLHSGFSLGNAHFTDLDYADDVAFLAHAVDDLHTALEVFETTASQLGLHVSWQKTKIQNLGTG